MKKLYKLSIITGAISVALYVISYFFFHYLTDTGFTSIKQEEAGKPYVTLMVGIVACLFFFASMMSLIIQILNNKESK